MACNNTTHHRLLVHLLPAPAAPHPGSSWQSPRLTASAARRPWVLRGHLPRRCPPVPTGAWSRCVPVTDCQPSARTTTSTSRRKFLKEAVLRRSGGVHHPMLLADSPPPPGAGAADPPQHLSCQAQSPILPSAHAPDTGSLQSLLAKPHLRPLFPPTTLITGDSIIRNIRFFNATTWAILGKLPGLLQSLPSSVTRLVVHVGTNDLAQGASELTKRAFISLLDFVHTCGKSVFISGPISTFGHGDARFSRLLMLNSWLKPACYAQGFNFTDNFNLFWNHPSFFKFDSIHPNTTGGRMLVANIQYSVHYAPRD
ncbi:hypothetical protein ABVT39_010579 [Epinephelus coioides]